MTQAATVEAILREMAVELERERDNKKKITDLKERNRLANASAHNMLNSVEDRMNRIVAAVGILSKQNEQEMLVQLKKTELLGGDSTAKSSDNSSSQSSLHRSDSQVINDFSGRISNMHSKLNLLNQFEKETKTFRKESADDNASLKKSMERMYEAESLHIQMMKRMQPDIPIEERHQSIKILVDSLTALDRLRETNGITPLQKNTINDLTRKIRHFLQNIPAEENIPPFDMENSEKSMHIPFSIYSDTDADVCFMNTQQSISNHSSSNSNTMCVTQVSETSVSLKSNRGTSNESPAKEGQTVE